MIILHLEQEEIDAAIRSLSMSPEGLDFIRLEIKQGTPGPLSDAFCSAFRKLYIASSYNNYKELLS